jgi:hypothetical protein
MKSLSMITLFMVFFSSASAQASKKPEVVKPTLKSYPVIKAVYWKRNFLLNPAVFSESHFSNENTTSMEMTIKLTHAKSTNISLVDLPAESIKELKEAYRSGLEGSQRKKPNAEGLTMETVTSGKVMLKYQDQIIEPLEYKYFYHGTNEQQALAAEKNKDIPLEKQLNEYSTDEKNHIFRIYLLPASPGNDKGVLMIKYYATIKDDKQNGGAKILQLLVDGISPMKFNEYNSFSTTMDKVHKIDFALPDSAKESFGQFSFKTSSGNGLVHIHNIQEATADYSEQVAAYIPVSGRIKESGKIERHTLFNGLNTFSRLLTMKGPGEDQSQSLEVYEWVNVLVPDNKTIHKPLLFILNTFRMNYAESKKMNAFILNSISLPGTLTKAAINNIKDLTKDEQPVVIKKK